MESVEADILILPNEILIHIIKYLDSQKDISSVCRVNRRFHWLFNRYLFQFHVLFHDGIAIMRATKRGDEITARRFLELGFPVDTSFQSPPRTESIFPSAETETRHAITPLRMAVVRGHQNLVHLFLDYGADTGQQLMNKVTPLYLALVAKEEKISRMISWHIPNLAGHLVYPEKRLSPLHLASHLGLTVSVHFFLGKGMDVNALDSRDNTPLHHALVPGTRRLTSYVNVFDPSTIFRAASQDQLLATVVALIEAGADLDREGISSQTPKDLAFEHHDERIRTLFGFPSRLEKLMRSEPRSVHIGRPWMSFAEQSFDGQAIPAGVSVYHGISQPHASQIPSLAKRLDAIRSCVPRNSLVGDESDSTSISFPPLTPASNSASSTAPDTPISTTWCQSKTTSVIANLTKPRTESLSSPAPSQRLHEEPEPFPQLSRNGREIPLARTAETRWKGFREASSAAASAANSLSPDRAPPSAPAPPEQHHEQVEPFPQLSRSNPDNPLGRTAEHTWKSFREASLPSPSQAEYVNPVNDAADLQPQRTRKARGKGRWQPLAL